MFNGILDGACRSTEPDTNDDKVFMEQTTFEGDAASLRLTEKVHLFQTQSG